MNHLVTTVSAPARCESRTSCYQYLKVAIQFVLRSQLNFDGTRERNKALVDRLADW